MIIPPGCVMRILRGPLFGKKWIKGSGVNGYWLGSYELPLQTKFVEAIKRGSVVYDIGAHVGFYTLLASFLSGRDGLVYSFEPFPLNANYLRKHTLLNGCKNVTVIEAAVGDTEGFSLFKEGESTFTGMLSPSGGSLSVRIVTLDHLLEEKKIAPPNVIKIDVEGAEFEVLRGAYKILKEFYPTILLAIHGKTSRQKCVTLLEELGYEVVPMFSGALVENSDELIAKKYS